MTRFICNLFAVCSIWVAPLFGVSPATPCPYIHTPLDFSLHYNIGSGRSYQEGYQGLETFFSLFSAELATLFCDVQVLRVDKGDIIGNFGVGWRSFSPDFCEAIGANIFYDVRQVPNGILHQVGVGVEYLTPNWELRANGYVPVGSNDVFQEDLVHNYPGGYVATAKLRKRGMLGFDLEVGKSLWCNKCMDVYGSVGPYFYSSACCDQIIGAIGRISVSYGRYISLECVVTRDDVFGTHAQAEVMLSLPFPFGCGTWRSPFRGIKRNPIIIMEDVCEWTTDW